MLVGKIEVSADIVLPMFDRVQLTPADDCIKNLGFMHDSALLLEKVVNALLKMFFSVSIWHV